MPKNLQSFCARTLKRILPPLSLSYEHRSSSPPFPNQDRLLNLPYWARNNCATRTSALRKRYKRKKKKNQIKMYVKTVHYQHAIHSFWVIRNHHRLFQEGRRRRALVFLVIYRIHKLSVIGTSFLCKYVL